ncbi:hypothetical protein A7K50_04685 [Dehalobacter sp. MCB1]|uniref:cytochrome c biogenesis protein ResB n=1 Tax=unclassified Dehalobacter TaxID=2635733 RepID=UPI000E6D3C58|nr:MULTISPECIES: cytochrome c biogenesis protein ResB [unclassified Dehalobacter]RJE47270.1 hypothetical protein A7K50_04685 [Dehalobacter sp. MCB1]TCX54876.1 hypothetical protein C1I38_04120 [Dehalobacter sp. 12DCB1]
MLKFLASIKTGAVRIPKLVRLLSEKQTDNHLIHFAPWLIHFAVIIILLGAFIKSFGGETDLFCFPDKDTAVPNPFADICSVHLKSFEIIYDDNGQIANWQSEIVMKRNGLAEVVGKTAVNHPIKSDGIKIYQSGYGYMHEMDLENTGKYETLNLPDDTPVQLSKNISVEISKTDSGYMLSKHEAGIYSGRFLMQPGTKIKVSPDITLTYKRTELYSVLKIKKDPGIPVVMAGFFLLCTGFFLLLIGKKQFLRKDKKNGLFGKAPPNN